MSVDASIREQVGTGPEDVDLVRLHDASPVEELEYCELLGVCHAGEAEPSIYIAVENTRIGLLDMMGAGRVCTIQMRKKES